MSELANKVLITGGLGYVGGRIARYLSEAAPEISLRLASRRKPGHAPQWARSMDLVQADVLERTSLEAALESIDTVIHLAAVNEVESQQDPDLALEVNGKGTHRLLEACRAQGVRRFVYVSTFHVYGPGAPQPITESTATRPVHPYAITHRLAEDFVNWYRSNWGMETLILRLSNGYGYPADPQVQRWTLVFNDLCRQAVRDGEIRLRSSGLQHRDFISLHDVARGVHHFLTLPADRWQDGLFNLGGDCSMPIIQVAQRVASEFARVYGKKIPVATSQGADVQDEAPVQFSINKLLGSGFRLQGDMSTEICETLHLCEKLETQANGGS